MITTSKFALSALAAGAIALAPTAKAGAINGSISFSGNVTAYGNTSDTGNPVGDFTVAQSLVFGASVVSSSPAPTGTFASVNTSTATVSVYSPMTISPLNVPASTLLWTVNSGPEKFFFTLTSGLTEPVAPSSTFMVLSGVGTMTDNLGDTATVGTWIATLSSASYGTNVTFSWSSSSSSTTSAPETGTSVLLLGLGLAAMGTYAQFRKQAA